MPASPFAILSECLTQLEREQMGAAHPVVDHEVVPPRRGDDGIQVWLICRTPEERRAFADTALVRTRAELRRKLLARGLSEDALLGLAVGVTSREEVAAQGGRFAGSG